MILSLLSMTSGHQPTKRDAYAGWTQCAPSPTGRERLTLYAAVKSFSSNGVPLTADFGLPAVGSPAPDAAIAAATLLPDGTPGYAGAAAGTSTTTGPAAFGLWYHSSDPLRLAASAAAQVRARSAAVHACNAGIEPDAHLRLLDHSLGEPWLIAALTLPSLHAHVGKSIHASSMPQMLCRKQPF